MQSVAQLVKKILKEADAIRACPSHEWGGPVKVVQLPAPHGGEVDAFQVKCRHCPLVKALKTREMAEKAIKEVRCGDQGSD